MNRKINKIKTKKLKFSCKDLIETVDENLSQKVIFLCVGLLKQTTNHFPLIQSDFLFEAFPLHNYCNVFAIASIDSTFRTTQRVWVQEPEKRVLVFAQNHFLGQREEGKTRFYF